MSERAPIGAAPVAARDTAAPKIPAELMRGLSPKRRELIRPVLDHPRDYVLLSVRKLADALGADAMAVLRAIRGMGFTGYAEFRRYLHELALVHATQLDTLQAGFTRESDIAVHLQESLSRGLEQPDGAQAQRRCGASRGAGANVCTRRAALSCSAAIWLPCS